MGGKSSRVQEASFITCGLDGGGKSTLVNHLKPAKLRVDGIAPTVGSQLETFVKDGVKFTVFDMGGGRRYRDLWQHHFREVGGAVFVIDSTDHIRLAVVKDEIKTMCEQKELAGAPILFFANKSDLPNSLGPADITDRLGLPELCEGRVWQIVQCCALDGTGVQQGIDWLLQYAKK